MTGGGRNCEVLQRLQRYLELLISVLQRYLESLILEEIADVENERANEGPMKGQFSPSLKGPMQAHNSSQTRKP